MNSFIIRAVDEVDDEGISLFWNNEFGWVSKFDADIFSSEEMLELNLPMGGIWEKVSQSKP